MRLTFTNVDNTAVTDYRGDGVLAVRFRDETIGYVRQVEGYHWLLGEIGHFGRVEFDGHDHYTSLDDAMFELTRRARREAIGHASVLEDEAFGWRTFADDVIGAEW